MRTYQELWLADENIGQEVIIEDLTVRNIYTYIRFICSGLTILSIVIFQQSFEDAELKKKDVQEEEGKPDPLLQLVTTFNRGATTERAGSTFNDELYMAYAAIMSRLSVFPTTCS